MLYLSNLISYGMGVRRESSLDFLFVKYSLNESRFYQTPLIIYKSIFTFKSLFLFLYIIVVVFCSCEMHMKIKSIIYIASKHTSNTVREIIINKYGMILTRATHLKDPSFQNMLLKQKEILKERKEGRRGGVKEGKRKSK